MRRFLPSLLPACLLCLCLLGAGGAAHAQYVIEDTASQTPRTGPVTKPARLQEEDKPSFFDRLSYGGNFSLSFGTVTYIDVSPLVVYNVTDRLQIGPGLTYIYYRYNQAPYQLSTSIYGGRLFGRYVVYENIFLQAELESLNLEVFNAEYHGRYWIVNPLVGGGYRLPIGSKGGVYLTALYNLNYNSNLSPYGSPLVFRVGVAF